MTKISVDSEQFRRLADRFSDLIGNVSETTIPFLDSVTVELLRALSEETGNLPNPPDADVQAVLRALHIEEQTTQPRVNALLLPIVAMFSDEDGYIRWGLLKKAGVPRADEIQRFFVEK